MRVRVRQPAVDTPRGPAGNTAPGEGRSLTPDGYALALTLGAGLPLDARAGLTAFLRPFEPHPAELREAVMKAHVSGHLERGALTPEGVRLALEALAGAALPPRSIRGPQWAGRRNP